MENLRTSNVSNSRVRLSWRLLLSYGGGHALNDICATMWFTYLLVFFHLVLNFDAVNSGIILLIGQIADALSTPFVGIESDRNNESWFCRFGKRKTWHLVGTVCVLCSFPFIFTPCIGCQNAHVYAQMVYYSTFVIIFQFGWASVQISHLALIPELTPDDEQRTRLTAIRYLFTVSSTVIIYAVIYAFLRTGSNNDESHQIGPSDAYNFQKAVFFGLCIGIIMSLIFYFEVREEPVSENKRRERNHKTALQFMKDFNFYKVAIVYMSSRLFVNLVQINIPLYIHETLKKNKENLAVVPLLVYGGSFFASNFVNILNTLCGRKVAYVSGTTIGIAAFIWIKFGHNFNPDIYYIAILLGISGCILIVTALGLTADLIGFDTDTGAFVYGSMSFVDKLSNGIAVMIIQYMKCDDCLNYYEKILVYVCGGFAIIGILPLLSLKLKPNNQEPEVDSYADSDETNPLLS